MGDLGSTPAESIGTALTDRRLQFHRDGVLNRDDVRPRDVNVVNVDLAAEDRGDDVRLRFQRLQRFVAFRVRRLKALELCAGEVAMVEHERPV